MNSLRLAQQIHFIKEIDKLKNIFRQTYLLDGKRRENDAEHSWHLAIIALLLYEHSNTKIDPIKVVKMVLLHDIVEIDAGDTFVYDTVARELQKEKEILAADRIFNLLPKDQHKEFRAIWDEFENGNSPEAKFARAIDRLQPILHNVHTEGKAWKKHKIKASQVLDRNSHIAEGSQVIWEYVQELVQSAVENQYLEKN